MSVRRLVAAASVWLAVPFSAAGLRAGAQVIDLKSGAQLRAEIISEKPDRVIVDLGFTVISIPRDEVDRITAVVASTDEIREAVLDGRIFRTVVNPPLLPVQANVERVGGAVVLVQSPTGLGSGFIIHPDGYVVTNHHVVAGETDLSVTRFVRGGGGLERVRHQNIRIVATDPRADLALLRIEDAKGVEAFPTVPIGDSHGLEEGQGVFAIGSPLGLDRTVSQGIVSSRNRLVDGQLYIQTTTQINPGNSGGPLFNLRGEVVGVNNMKAMAIGVEGLNFAIPADVLKNFLRNRDAFAFDPRNPNAGFRYNSPPRPVSAARSDAPADASSESR
jgi:Trypsin-like serine proteases, typically periplasmic, contain C-terminal PDZ domain